MQKNKKFYFISYSVDKLGFTKPIYQNKAIDIHPFEWQIKMHKEYRNGKLIRDIEDYILLWFVEITEEKYIEGQEIEY